MVFAKQRWSRFRKLEHAYVFLNWEVQTISCFFCCPARNGGQNGYNLPVTETELITIRLSGHLRIIACTSVMMWKITETRYVSGGWKYIKSSNCSLFEIYSLHQEKACLRATFCDEPRHNSFICWLQSGEKRGKWDWYSQNTRCHLFYSCCHESLILSTGLSQSTSYLKWLLLNI